MAVMLNIQIEAKSNLTEMCKCSRTVSFHFCTNLRNCISRIKEQYRKKVIKNV